ncbi:hypothetical protein [Oryza sativa Japonica Group]|uniref:Uncharacterized protein n=1 Tax=Oryza sativa subsp. japonica TaxID=39947 RepID=Q8LI09_ORYSJ|nr:hypothetical protein [Oryza sativa Japonica Group]
MVFPDAAHLGRVQEGRDREEDGRNGEYNNDGGGAKLWAMAAQSHGNGGGGVRVRHARPQEEEAASAMGRFGPARLSGAGSPKGRRKERRNGPNEGFFAQNE